MLFDSFLHSDGALPALAGDLLAAESSVIVVGGADVPDSTHIPTPIAHVGAEVARTVMVI
ncbi:hypothetical protein [Mycobacterium tilburgii]|uniref:hypothetical protein n=1 Tax=Mycobacterium tilburgii TaxID=44467 RepID=UPI0011821AFA|nr:hypothetical protein [Mycobacterium tilburgii]